MEEISFPDVRVLSDLFLTTKSYSTPYPLLPLRWLTEKFGDIPPTKKNEITTISKLYKHDRDTARLGATVCAFIGGATLAALGKVGNTTTMKVSFVFNMVALTCFTNEWASTSPSRKRPEEYRWTPWLAASSAQLLLVFSIVQSIFPEEVRAEKPQTQYTRVVKAFVDYVKPKLSTRTARLVGPALISMIVFVPAAWRMEVEIEERRRLAQLIKRKNEKYVEVGPLVFNISGELAIPDPINSCTPLKNPDEIRPVLIK